MYLTIAHEKAPAQLWLDEMIQIKDDKPELEVGGTIKVYWVPGRRTAMRADAVKRGVISLAAGLTAIIVGIALMFVGASVE